MVKDEMPGWKTPGMGQSNPGKLKKILGNIEDMKRLVLPEDTVLDVGCYHGHLSEHLGYAKYAGMDLYEENVAQARETHPGFEFFQGDLFDLTGKWDVVICSRVLMHIPHFEIAVERLRSCCRKALIVLIPIGQDECSSVDVPGGKVYFRIYPRERVVATGPQQIIKHAPYCTVIYGPNLP